MQQELREELTVGEVKDFVQSHTAREQGPGLVLVCLTVARLPTLYHPVPKEAALPSAHESSSLAWVWGLNTPLAEFSAAAAGAVARGELGRLVPTEGLGLVADLWL